jgi:2-oxo-4-hydroxy-4-carboxy-5-ureidoimidazoline decarboxylase
VTRLSEFNGLSADQAAELLRPCLDVARWVSEIVDGRPYRSVDDLFATARSAAHPFTAAELEEALAHHPRIGERADGASAEAHLSRTEQAGLDLDDDVQVQLKEGNRAYEQRFGRVFLIRAAGRSSGEILASLRARLDNDVETEDGVVADQLRQIALVRLAGAVSP